MRQHEGRALRVGDWLVEPRLNQISRQDHGVSLRPQVMDLLVYLISRPHEVVSFDDIVDVVWKGAFVSDGSVYSCVNELRRVLGDDKDEPSYIETISKRGYRLIAELGEAAEVACAPSAVPSKESQQQTAAQRAPAPISGHRWSAPVAIALVLLVVGGWFWTNRTPIETENKIPVSAKSQRLPNSIAVLPFNNLSSNPDDAFFAAGIHEEILNQLSKIKDLAIIARTSVMQYADADKPIQQIAADLNVETVMEGNVRYDGNRVRITAQLIDGTTGAHLWSETYDRDFADIFTIQSDIAFNVTGAIKAQFSIEEQQAIAKAPTNNLQAYEHYLRALARPAALEVLVDRHRDLDAAIALDPDFALAWGYQAFLYAWQTEGTGDIVALTPESQQQNIQLARLHAERALAIDPDQADALMALSFVDEAELQWASADARVERAYLSNPSRGYIVLVYGHNLILQGRTSEAIELHQESFELDPQNWLGVWAASKFQYGYGDLAVAARFAERLIEMVPQSTYGYSELALIAAMAGDRDKALVMAQQAESAMDLAPSKYSALTVMEAYRWLGRPEDVERLFGRLQTIGETNTLNDGDLFRAYFALGQNDRALDHLASAAEARFPVLGTEIVSPFAIARNHAPLWGNPRYEAAIRKMNLDEHYPRASPPPAMGSQATE